MQSQKRIASPDQPGGDASLVNLPIHRQDQPGRHAPSPRQDDIVEYWSRLSGDRPFPAPADIDEKTLAFSWPHTVFFRIGPDGGPVSVDRAIGPQGSLVADALVTAAVRESTPLGLAEWLLTLALDTANAGRPVIESVEFPMGEDRILYRCQALPLGEEDGRVDSVLVHYEPVG